MILIFDLLCFLGSEWPVNGITLLCCMIVMVLLICRLCLWIRCGLWSVMFFIVMLLMNIGATFARGGTWSILLIGYLIVSSVVSFFLGGYLNAIALCGSVLLKLVVSNAVGSCRCMTVLLML